MNFLHFLRIICLFGKDAINIEQNFTGLSLLITDSSRFRRRTRGLMNDDNRSTVCVCNFVVVSTARSPFACGVCWFFLLYGVA